MATAPVVSAHRPVLTPAEEAWIARGGRLVLAIDQEADGALADTTAGPSQVVLPLLPGVHRLVPGIPRHLDPHLLLDGVAVVTTGDGVVIARRSIGRGELWLLACPGVLANDRLGQADHLALLLALAGGGRPVWFDEYVHGAEHGLGVAELLRRWGLGPAAALGLLAAGAWYWRRRVILGEPADPWRDRRAEAVEGLEAIAHLYRRAMTPVEAVELHRARLTREIALRTGQRLVAAHRQAERHLAGAGPPVTGTGPAAVAAALRRLNHAYRSFRDEHRRRRP